MLFSRLPIFFRYALWIPIFLFLHFELLGQGRGFPSTIISPEGHIDEVTCLLSHPNLPQLISASRDGTVRFWDIDTGELVKTLYMFRASQNEAEIRTMDISIEGDLLAVGGSGLGLQGIQLVDLTTNRVVKSLGPPFSSRKVTALAFSPDGRTLRAGYNNGKVKTWRLKDPSQNFDNYAANLTKGSTPLRRYSRKVAKSKVLEIEHAENLGYFLGASSDGRIVAFRTDETMDDSPIKRMFKKVEWSRYLLRGPAGLHIFGDSLVMVAGGNGKLKNFHANSTSKPVRTMAIIPKGIGTMAVSPDQESYFIGGDLPCHAAVVETMTGNIRALLTPNLHLRKITASVFLSDSLLATGDLEGNVFLWDALSGDLIGNLSGNGGSIRALGIGRGKHFAAGSAISSRAFHPCELNSKKQQIPVHPLEWVFDIENLQVSVELERFEPFSHPQLSKNNLKMQVKDASGYYSVKRTFRDAVEYRHRYRISGFGTLDLPGQWDPFWTMPAYMKKDGLLLPGGDYLRYYYKSFFYGKIKYDELTVPAAVAMEDEGRRYILAGGKDRILRVYKRRTRKLLCSLFVISENNWVCWTPDLYITGKGSALQQVGYMNKEEEVMSARFTSLASSPLVKRDGRVILERLNFKR